jgi:hypothetical protein
MSHHRIEPLVPQEILALDVGVYIVAQVPSKEAGIHVDDVLLLRRRVGGLNRIDEVGQFVYLAPNLCEILTGFDGRRQEDDGE